MLKLNFQRTTKIFSVWYPHPNASPFHVVHNKIPIQACCTRKEEKRKTHKELHPIPFQRKDRWKN
jgi:hypothetical protein